MVANMLVSVAIICSGSFLVRGTIDCEAGVCSGSFIATSQDDASPSLGPDAGLDNASYPDAATPDVTAPLPVGLYEPPDPSPQPSTPQGARLMVPVIPQPDVGGSACDPTFGTCSRRLIANGKHEYSQLQAFADDDSMILLFNGSTYAIYRYPSMDFVASNPSWSSMRWIPRTHKLVRILGAPVRVMILDADSGQEVLGYQAPAPFQFDYTSQTEEGLSEDGRWMSLFPQWGNGVGRTMQALDIQAGVVGASLAIDALYAGPCTKDPTYGAMMPDFVAVSPLGAYLAVQWQRSGGTRCSGLELYDIQTGAFVRQLHQHGNHGDWGVTPGGREFYMTVSIRYPLTGASSGSPGIVLEFLDDASLQGLREIAWDPTSGSAFGHCSCKGPRGACLISGEGAHYSGGPNLPMLGEIYLMNLDGSTRRLAFHRSASSSYWSQPKATWSKSGKHIVYSSDWGVSGGNPSPYSIDLP